MDPNANLAEQRRLIVRICAAGGDVDAVDVLRLTELVEALDGWLSNGGFLPKAWAQ